MPMSTLTSEPVSSLLDTLFAEADARTPQTQSAWASLTGPDGERLMHDRSSYREFYARLKDVPLPVSRQTGRLLYMLARSSDARTVVEFGTSFGISTIHLAAALRDNGGTDCSLITSEFEAGKIDRAKTNLTEAGLVDLVHFRQGDALQTLAVDLPNQVDFLFLDGAKSLYGDILHLVQPRLRDGAWIVADNADHSPAYLKHIRAPENGYLSVPVAEDVELSLWVGN